MSSTTSNAKCNPIIMKISLSQRKTFAVSYQGRSGGLSLDWQTGFSLHESGTEPNAVSWQYKFSQLRGSSDDSKSKLKLHFQDQETRSIETKVSDISIIFAFCFNIMLFLCEEFELVSFKILYFGNFLYLLYFTISSSSSFFFSNSSSPQELECQVLQSLLFCMHAFLTAKVACVDPQFLNSIQQT